MSNAATVGSGVLRCHPTSSGSRPWAVSACSVWMMTRAQSAISLDGS